MSAYKNLKRNLEVRQSTWCQITPEPKSIEVSKDQCNPGWSVWSFQVSQ